MENTSFKYLKATYADPPLELTNSPHDCEHGQESQSQLANDAHIYPGTMTC